MQQSLIIQDPTSPATAYQFESIVAAALHASEWRGIFAFATKGGIEKLLTDDAFVDFFDRGGVASLTVGIDAITNRAALERLLELDEYYPGLTSTIFWTPNASLFHPKLSHFRLEDGTETLIVGSGNLTPGGLQGNFEAYSVTSSGPGEPLDTAELDAFLIRHAANIRPIDDAALERASKNVVQRVKGKNKTVDADGLDDAAPEPTQPEAAEAEPVPLEPLEQPVQPNKVPIEAALIPQRRVLIAEVPKAGGRWEQAHFNAAVIDEFFHVTDSNVQRVFLTYVQPNGARGDEQPRRVVYSTANLNYKIEIENPGGRAYPQDGRPLLVMVETAVRASEYVLLFPNDPGHAEMLEINQQLPSVGKGLRRVITTLPDVHGAWPQAPFFIPAP